MEVYEAPSINMLYPYIIEDVKKAGTKVRIDRPDAVDSFTSELRPMVINVADPRRRLISGRPINVAFALAEVLWILAGRKDVEMLEFYNSQISQFSDDGQVFNAAYGYRLRHAFGHDQIEDRIRDLQDDRSSRQATLVISNPVDDKGWDRYMLDDDDDPTAMGFKKKVTKDRACNVVSHMLLRDGSLDWMQVVRSNDLVWGLPYNWMQFTHLQEYIASRLNARVGTYTHMIHSAHIYSHHFNEPTSHFDLYTALEDYSHQPMWADDEAMNIVLREETALRERSEEPVISDDDFETMGGYWTSVLHILAAHRFYKVGDDKAAMECLEECGDAVLALTALRFYYSKRWDGGDSRIRAMALDCARGIARQHTSVQGASDVANWITGWRRGA